MYTSEQGSFAYYVQLLLFFQTVRFKHTFEWLLRDFFFFAITFHATSLSALVIVI